MHLQKMKKVLFNKSARIQNNAAPFDIKKPLLLKKGLIQTIFAIPIF